MSEYSRYSFMIKEKRGQKYRDTVPLRLGGASGPQIFQLPISEISFHVLTAESSVRSQHQTKVFFVLLFAPTPALALALEIKINIIKGIQV